MPFPVTDDLAPQLLAAIVARPDEDEPRLVYADHLQQRGDARGEFIAVQVALAAGPAASHPDSLRARERELVREHGARWRAELGLNRKQARDFTRGFIEEVSLPARLFLSLGKQLVAGTPLQTLNLSKAGATEMRELTSSALLSQLTHLGLNHRVSAESAALLADCPHLSRLRSLNVSSTQTAGARHQPPLRAPGGAGPERQ
jgi:uncharacterized protein (TIGR02996 family)